MAEPKEVLPIRIAPQVKKQLAQIAAELDMTVSSLCALALRTCVSNFQAAKQQAGDRPVVLTFGHTQMPPEQ